MVQLQEKLYVKDLKVKQLSFENKYMEMLLDALQVELSKEYK